MNPGLIVLLAIAVWCLSSPILGSLIGRAIRRGPRPREWGLWNGYVYEQDYIEIAGGRGDRDLYDWAADPDLATRWGED